MLKHSLRKRFMPGGILILLLLCSWSSGLETLSASTTAQLSNGPMTEEKALALAEQFGVDVGEVDEEVKDILGLTKAEGVVVYEVIGGSPAELAGIKVKAPGQCCHSAVFRVQGNQGALHGR